MDENSEDAAAWNAQKEESAKNLRTGALVAAGGLVFGISNRIALDKKYNKRFEKLREDFKKANEEFVATHDGVEVENLNNQIANLKQMVENQTDTINNQNQMLENLQNQLAAIEPITNAESTEVSRLVFEDNKETIYFKTGSSQVDSTTTQTLQDYAKKVIIPTLTNNPGAKLTITIEGHTDTVGNADSNMALSKKRAEAIASKLEEVLTDYKDRVDIKSEGKGQAECDNNGDQQSCRKIVITITAEVPPETDA
jgi:outer membrane protein OmpA-like peptidoglycan-associated protein